MALWPPLHASGHHSRKIGVSNGRSHDRGMLPRTTLGCEGLGGMPLDLAFALQHVRSGWSEGCNP